MVDGYTRVMLTVIAVLLTVLAVGMWCETPQMSQTAAAGRIPDSGLQFDSIRQSVDQVNQSIQQLSNLMVSGQVRVRVVDPAGGSTAKTTE